MFSDHMRKIDRTSGRNLLLIAAGLVIVCQLVAMALVADGQVKKAELRESHLNSQRVALARCFEVNSRFDRHSCLQQSGSGATDTAAMATLVSSSGDLTDAVTTSQLVRVQVNGGFGVSPQSARGFMPVAFN